MPHYRTLEAQPNDVSLIKPGELVDIIEMTPLTLTDRRIYNLLIEHAWDTIDKPVEHSIAKQTLRGSHSNNDRVGETIERLMAAIVKVRVLRDGKEEIERVQLLGGNAEQVRADGIVRYEFPAKLRRIVKNSTIFARLHKEVMLALSSKYALALYEMVQKRCNMRRNYEEIPLAELRGYLGVPRGKLLSWSNLSNRALKPAVKEVSALSDFIVEAVPVQKGRKIIAVKLSWWPKDGEGIQQVATELNHSKVGRKARIEGTVERVDVATSTGNIPLLRDKTLQNAKEKVQPYGLDANALELEWRHWASRREAPNNPDGAFLKWLDTHLERNAYPVLFGS